jgi:hypothetical protein
MSYWDRTTIAFGELKGKTITAIEKTDDTMTFKVDDGSEYEMYHSQDCCESVYIESVVGDLEDLIGEPILIAEEATSGEDPADYKSESTYRESVTWTFYKLATRKGYVDLRWLGESNGYYSERVSFSRTVEPTNIEANQ